MDDCVWQMVGIDEWVFGRMVRGMVRVHLAEVYFDEDSESKDGGWVWIVMGQTERGRSPYRWGAVACAEQALGAT